MKLNAILGKGSGKVGGLVFAVNGGVQIVKEKASKVSNPNTDAQVAQRAKLKLMSQLAAALAPALAFVKKGLVSARNQFVSTNIEFASFSEGKAIADIESLQLSPGSLSMPDLNVTRGQNNMFTAALLSAAPENIASVIYAVFKKNSNEELEFISKVNATTPGDGRTFETTIQGATEDCVVFAYGIVANSSEAKVNYLNYVAEAGVTNATLDVTRLTSIAGVSTTKTTGYDVFAG